MTDRPQPSTYIRAFLAIDLPEDIKTTIGKIQSRLRPLTGGGHQGIRWTRPESIHLTLHFFGSIPFDQIELISEVVKKNVEGIPPFMLNLGSLGAFPTVSKPRVIFLGLGGQIDILQRLQGQIAADLHELGFEREERAFTAHLTLGRLKSVSKLPGISEAFQKVIALAEGNFMVKGLKLFKSDLRPDGAVYTVLEYFPMQDKGN